MHICADQLLYQVLSLLTDATPNFASKSPATFFDPVENLFIGTVKGSLTTEKDVKDDTDTPQVTLFTVFTLENLRGDIVWCSLLLCHLTILSTEMVGCSKIDDFDGTSIFSINKQIFWF